MKNMQLSTEQLAQLLETAGTQGVSSSKAMVTTAIKLDSASQQQIATAIEGQVGSQVNCEFEVDPEVIGGMKVEVGDFVFDGTVAGQLRDLVKTLHT